MNNVLSRHVIDFDSTTVPNTYQLFRRTHYDTKNGRILCYYICSNEDNTPPGDINWSHSIKYNLIHTPITRSSTKLTFSTPDTSSNSPPKVPSKRKKSYQHSTTSSSQQIRDDIQQEKASTSTLSSSNSQKSTQICKETRWQAPETMKLFTGKKQSPTLDIQSDPNAIRKHVASQVILLRRAYLSAEGWREIVDDKDEQDTCSPHQIFKIQQKAKYLYATLAFALKHFGVTTNSFYDVCKLSIQKVNDNDSYYSKEVNELLDDDVLLQDLTELNKKQIINPRTITSWHRDFRENSYFPNPSRHSSHKRDLPRLLHDNPDIKESLDKWCDQNIDSVSAENIHHFLIHSALPQVVKKINQERKEHGDYEEYTLTNLLNDNGLKVLTIQTVNIWMRQMGFKYEPRKKCYYVDTHNKPENVEYRRNFIKRYAEYELRSYRWISIEEWEYNKMVKNKELQKGMGYRYVKDKITYYECHVDCHEKFQERCAILPFGGQLSVRKDPNKKPIMMLGQDECINKQFTFSPASWTLPNGKKPLLPKDEGAGVMISAFTSRELGYGPVELTQDQLDKVNSIRRGRNATYSDQDAAISLFGTAVKPKLTKSPFVFWLDYGANAEGYWNYERMVIQLEDCVDVL